jgi:hypothetical protein
MALLVRLFRKIPTKQNSPGLRSGVLAILVGAACLCASSCTLFSHSPNLVQKLSIPTLERSRGLVSAPTGKIPYQRWKTKAWDEELRYVWVVGNHDFRKFDHVDIVLYFHGMHSKDYYSPFERVLDELAAKRPDRPFLFVGFVDTPYSVYEGRDENRWKFLVPRPGERPDRLFDAVNSLFTAFRKTFPNVNKNKTKIVLAGFSGGGRVLDSVGSWLAASPKEDPYAKVFSSRLSKIVYFDCWFDRSVLQTVPTLLESNPGVKIVGTVHMKKPKETAALLAGKLNMKADKTKDEMVGVGGRFMIFNEKSHWHAIISRLRQALEV